MNHIHRLWRLMRQPKKSKLGQILETIFVVVPIAFLIRTFGYGLYQVPTGSMETTMLVGERFFADKFSIFFKGINPGDIITFNDPTYTYSPNYFANVWQRYVWGPSNWTKRVIGVPGDHIQGKMENNVPVVYRNGQKLLEPYINKYPLIAVMQDYYNEQWHYRSYDPNYSYDNQPFYKMNADEVISGKKFVERSYNISAQKLPNTPAYERGRNGDVYDFVLGDDQYWVMGDNRLGSLDARFWGATGRPLHRKLIHGKIVFRIWSMDSTESWWIIDLLKNPLKFFKKIRWSRCLQIVR